MVVIVLVIEILPHEKITSVCHREKPKIIASSNRNVYQTRITV